MNVLVLGSDTRDPGASDPSDPARSDTMMLLHVDADAPARVRHLDPARHLGTRTGGAGRQRRHHGEDQRGATRGAVYPLAVQTVEEFTGVRVDHVVLVDFAGFQQVVDEMGGVDLTVDQTITSIFPPYREFRAGRQHLTGSAALDYVRQRYQYDDGDLTREKHQQQLLAALLDQAANAGTLTDLGPAGRFPPGGHPVPDRGPGLRPGEASRWRCAACAAPTSRT